MDMSRVSTTTFPLVKLPLDEAMAVVAAAGFSRIDLLGRMPHFSLDAEEWDPAAAAAMAQTHGLTIANLATYVGAGFASADEAERQKEWADVRRAIDIAAQVGARSIRGFRSPKYDNAADVPRIVPWIKRCAEYAAEKGVYMGLENHGGGISGVPEVCRDLADQVGSPYFGVLYDPCNLHTRGTDYRRGLETMKDHIVHVHLKDGTSENASQKHTMLGEGEIDVAWICRRLDEIGYDGDVALEYEMETEPPESGLKKWYEALRRLVDEGAA